ncbi:MAG: putative DNA binding domain-containing protein [bacterium]|nr:putative DNA binding domain-containing protein [bacterium]
MVFPFSDGSLERLSKDLESDRVERKRSAADRHKIRRNVCAFANDLPNHEQPGVVFIGIEDDGTCSGIVISDQLLRTLADMRDDGNIIPLPSLTVEKRELGGCEVAVVVVQPSRSPPVRYNGRVWVKIGPTVRQATPEEEQRLAERRRAGDLPFDSRPASDAVIQDLDLTYVTTQYLPRSVAQDVLDQNQRPLPHQLRSLRLLVGDTPTWGALLSLSPDPLAWLPGAYVQMLRIDGTEITDPILAEYRLTGRLEDVLRRLGDLLQLNIRTRVDVTTHLREIRQPDYPLVALRQLAFNAVMHRRYDGTNAPIRIHWYTNRVEITSPGGLYGQVTSENFGTGTTDYRNPLVAEMMHGLGFAQRFGMGIPLARKELEQNGNPPPDFGLAPANVTVTVRQPL